MEGKEKTRVLSRGDSGTQCDTLYKNHCVCLKLRSRTVANEDRMTSYWRNKVQVELEVKRSRRQVEELIVVKEVNISDKKEPQNDDF